MNCLNNYIGIRGYGSVEPLSGIYINQVPGISLESIDKLAEKEQLNFAGLWKDVQALAWLKFEKDFRIALRKKYKIKGIKGNSFITNIIDKDTIIEPSAEYKGILIDLGLNGGFATLSIDKIVIELTEQTASATIKIIDHTGEILDSFTRENLAAGRAVFNVVKRYPSTKVFIAIDATTVPVYSAEITKDSLRSCIESCNLFCDNSTPLIYGATCPTDDLSLIEKTDDVYGMQINYGVLCDHSSIICNNKSEFTDVWLYLLGMQLMTNRLFTSRMNRFTTIDREQAGELLDYCTTEYYKSLNEAVKALEISRENICIECNEMISSRVSTP